MEGSGMKILDYIQNAGQYLYRFGTIDPFKEILESDKEERFLIVPNSMISYVYKKDFLKLLEQYNVAEIYELSNCFLGTSNQPYIFIHIVKQDVRDIKIAMFNQPTHLYRDDSYDPECKTIRWVKDYRKEYLNYLENLDYWRATDLTPSNIKFESDFRKILAKEFRNDILYPRFYMEVNDDIRGILKNDTIKKLNEVAEILDVQIDYGATEVGRVLGHKDLPMYPYIPEKDYDKFYISNVRLHKGDIVEKRGKFFLLNKEPIFELYASCDCKVIRAKKVSPEYLYIYLISRIATRIRLAFSVSVIDKMPKFSEDIKEFPIVLPQYDKKHYEELFEKISNPDERFFESLTIPNKTESVADVLDLEILVNIKLNNEELLRTHIDSDIEELKLCYDNKAYKALVIMAGAVLEAFLIDWKSEIDQVNYFETDLIVTKKDGSTGKAELADYIYLLYKEYEPKWNRMSKKAHMIRDKRNRVHVKVCLNKKEEITKELCLEIIDNLKEIVESREKLTT